MSIPTRKFGTAGGYLLVMAAPLFFAAAAGLAVLLPQSLALPACAALYAFVVLAEALYDIYSPQSLLLGSYFAGSAAAGWLFPEQIELEGYAVGGGFAVLFLLSLRHLFGSPVRQRREELREPRPVRRAKAGVWLVLCPLAIALSLPRGAMSGAMAVQLGLAALAAAAVCAIDLLYCGPFYRRSRKFALGGFTFREIERDEASVSRFLSNYADEISAAVSRDRRAKVRYSRSDIFEEACCKEKAVTARVRFFQAYDGDKVVGGVGIALEGSDRRLPVERSAGVTFDPLRRYGRVMEVRRLSVDGSYRFQPEIIRGLLKCAIEVALENDISFMVDFAFHFVVELFRKVDFEVVQTGGRDSFEFGSPMRLVALNFARRQLINPLVLEHEPTGRYAANQCLRHRYRRRSMIRQAWRAERRRAWSLSSVDIDKLCVPVQEAPAASGYVGSQELARP